MQPGGSLISSRFSQQALIKNLSLCILTFGLLLKTSPVGASGSGGNQQKIDLSPGLAKTDRSLDFDIQAEEMKQILLKRQSMLKIHKHLAYTTFILMTASALTSDSSGDTHKILGLATFATYAGTAYFSLFAPKPKGLVPSDAKVWHQRLAWVHGLGMILTPALGLIRYQHEKKGRSASDLGKLHTAAAITTYAAFTAALMVIIF